MKYNLIILLALVILFSCESKKDDFPSSNSITNIIIVKKIKSPVEVKQSKQLKTLNVDNIKNIVESHKIEADDIQIELLALNKNDESEAIEYVNSIFASGKSEEELQMICHAAWDSGNLFVAYNILSGLYENVEVNKKFIFVDFIDITSRLDRNKETVLLAEEGLEKFPNVIVVEQMIAMFGASAYEKTGDMEKASYWYKKNYGFFKRARSLKSAYECKIKAGDHTGAIELAKFALGEKDSFNGSEESKRRIIEFFENQIDLKK